MTKSASAAAENSLDLVVRQVLLEQGVPADRIALLVPPPPSPVMIGAAKEKVLRRNLHAFWAVDGGTTPTPLHVAALRLLLSLGWTVPDAMKVVKADADARLVLDLLADDTDRSLTVAIGDAAALTASGKTINDLNDLIKQGNKRYSSTLHSTTVARACLVMGIDDLDVFDEVYREWVVAARLQNDLNGDSHLVNRMRKWCLLFPRDKAYLYYASGMSREEATAHEASGQYDPDALRMLAAFRFGSVPGSLGLLNA